MPAFTNAKQQIPDLFKEIMRNHAEQAAIREKGFGMSQIDWRQLKILRCEMAEYRRGAERMLHHNVDKGNTA